MRDTPNSTRIHRWLAYCFACPLQVNVVQPVPGWLQNTDPTWSSASLTQNDWQPDVDGAITKGAAVYSNQPMEINLLALPMHHIIRSWESLKKLADGTADADVVVFQSNGVFFYAGMKNGVVDPDHPVGKMSDSTHLFFERMQKEDKITKKKRQFTEIEDSHIQMDANNDEI